ncbi:NAD(P)-binding protein [Laetiporus sulphureus 93-53]|uniref:NAD(P)-binding protein n=1 Tax=Laetiporus sulphureus 93-53 TaxID=1314785 RepID=A0A165BAW6_9APHY|nr:NAD(P)-binding protein [Laetiporus sulphureus 93-53]KZT00641.1 NAD(P)-binding protein [Laetiporus sulphureus 93-53]
MSGSTSFQPRVAIITGAAQGIGKEIALRLARDGLDVAVNDISSKSEELEQVVAQIQDIGRQAIALVADVSDEEQVRNMVEKTVQKLGRLDVMVANAGISVSGSILDMNMEQWNRTININLHGVMLCYKYAAEQMVKQGTGGRLIGASKLSAYCTSKFAVRGLTQALALELAEHKITVNTYAPGVILTSMTNDPLRDPVRGGTHGASAKFIIGVPPDGPDAGPEVVASIVSYLVKPEAYFITGQSISVDGGVHMD